MTLENETFTPNLQHSVEWCPLFLALEYKEMPSLSARRPRYYPEDEHMKDNLRIKCLSQYKSTRTAAGKSYLNPLWSELYDGMVRLVADVLFRMKRKMLQSLTIIMCNTIPLHYLQMHMWLKEFEGLEYLSNICCIWKYPWHSKTEEI